jgi:hypothetical protein
MQKKKGLSTLSGGESRALYHLINLHMVDGIFRYALPHHTPPKRYGIGLLVVCNPARPGLCWLVIGSGATEIDTKFR